METTETTQIAEDRAAALLGVIFESSVDCMKLIDLEGRLVFLNRKGQEALELDDVSPALGQPWAALWPVGIRPTLEVALRRAADGEEARLEAACPTAKGRKKVWDVTIAPVRDRNGIVTCLLATSRDVTRRASTEQMLLEREAELERLIAREAKAKLARLHIPFAGSRTRV